MLSQCCRDFVVVPTDNREDIASVAKEIFDKFNALV
jgi:hypothetical protein